MIEQRLLQTNEPVGGRYQIECCLGRGGSASVYRAIDLSDGSIVALKHFDQRGGPRRHFLRELGGLIGLRHPSIVELHTVLMSGKERYLVLEFCNGGSLRDAMHQGTSSLDAALGFLAQAAVGVGHAHACGIVHRDLKPENILVHVDEAGQAAAKVADFGIAWGAVAEQDAGAGSPAYMAPERFYDSGTEASDVYSLGLVLYEIVCGYRPFRGTTRQVVRGHLFGALHIPQWVTGRARELLEHSLARDPEVRLDSSYCSELHRL